MAFELGHTARLPISGISHSEHLGQEAKCTRYFMPLTNFAAAGPTAPTEDAAMQAEGAPAAETAPVGGAAAMEAAVERAAQAESALSEALEAVEDLEARCASAQARELEAKRGAQARIDELVAELEEADGHGAKVRKEARKF